MTPAECARCLVQAGHWYIRLRKSPTVNDGLVDLGTRDPGPGWWADARAGWNLADAPLESLWLPPELVVVAPVKCGPTPDAPMCGFCRREAERNVTPGLFDLEGGS